MGQFVGDGNFASGRKSPKTGEWLYRAEAKLWDIAGDDCDAAEFMQEVARRYATRSDWAGWSQVSGRPYQKMSITGVVRHYGMNPKNKHDASMLEGQSSKFYRGFLRGLFDADGHVEGYLESDNYKGLSIRLWQSNYELLQSVQRMLLRLGINSRIYKAKDAGRSWLPDGRGGHKYYNTKKSWRLVISSDSAWRYADTIGFMHAAKAEKLEFALSWRQQKYTKPRTATVKSFDFMRRGEVWDTEVETVHAFDANGIYAHNSEISLSSYETCNLVELHLNRHESLEDFLRTIKFAYLYAKSITLLPTHWPQTNAVIQRNRRIGTSMTGIAGFVDTKGLPEFRKWANSGYGEVQRLDKVYSEWLGVRESIRTTTVKPSGSVSLLSGATPGVHWPAGGKYYLRAIRFANSDPMLTLLKLAQYKVEADLYSDNTSVVYFPMKTDMERSEKNVSIYEKIHLASEAQAVWSDNAVSVTVTFDPKTEKDAVPRVLRMYEGNLKTVSFLPMSNDVYPQMPYTEITEQEYEEYLGTLLKIDLGALYEGVDNLEAIGDKYCSNDSCTI